MASPAAPCRFDHVLQPVDFAAGKGCRAWSYNGLDDATRLDHLVEHPEAVAGGRVADVHEFEAKAQVGLVGPVALHGVGIGDAGEGFLEQPLVGEFAGQAQVERLDEFEDVLALDEGHFDVELSELGGAVGAQVFVAVAARQLKVAVQPGHHEQLLELLGRLRQRVGLAGIVAAGHDEVAGALGRALDQGGRFQFQEVALPEVFAHDAGDVEAQFESDRACGSRRRSR